MQGQDRSIKGDLRKFKLAPVENVKSSISLLWMVEDLELID